MVDDNTSLQYHPRSNAALCMPPGLHRLAQQLYCSKFPETLDNFFDTFPIVEDPSPTTNNMAGGDPENYMALCMPPGLHGLAQQHYSS